jgi:hypothetical protein
MLSLICIKVTGAIATQTRSGFRAPRTRALRPNWRLPTFATFRCIVCYTLGEICVLYSIEQCIAVGSRFWG